MTETSESPSPIQPYVLAALLCDTIITEAGSNKKTLVGLFDRVFATTYPAPQRFGLYVKLTDAEGLYRIRLDYVNREANRVIERIELGEVRVPDRLRSADVVLMFTTMIPEPGSYEFRLFANDAFLTHVDFSAVPIPAIGEPSA